MICRDCQKGGDAYTSSQQENLIEKLKQDYIGKAKSHHARCKDSGCLCQHRVGRNLI